VGAIVARVWADTEKTVDRFANLRRIGIDEISYKQHRHNLLARRRDNKGCTTNLTSARPQSVIDAYHQLWHIEKSFRMSKHDLQARPIYHHNPRIHRGTPQHRGHRFDRQPLHRAPNQLKYQ